MLCALVTGEQPVESPSQIAQDLKVLFFPKHTFALQAAVQPQHEEENPFTWEEWGRNWPAQQRLFSCYSELVDPRRCTLAQKDVTTTGCKTL